MGLFWSSPLPEEMAAAPGSASIPPWAEAFSKHGTVKRKQTNEGFIDFPPLDSQAPAPLLPHITIVVLSTVTLWDPNPFVCPWMQHQKTANSVIFCQQLWKHSTFCNPIKIVLNTSTRCGGLLSMYYSPWVVWLKEASDTPSEEILRWAFITPWTSNISHS